MKKSELRQLIREEYTSLMKEDYGWEIQRGKEFKALEDAIKVFGAEDLLNQLAQIMGNNDLRDALSYVFRNADYESPYLK